MKMLHYWRIKTDILERLCDYSDELWINEYKHSYFFFILLLLCWELDCSAQCLVFIIFFVDSEVSKLLSIGFHFYLSLHISFKMFQQVHVSSSSRVHSILAWKIQKSYFLELAIHIGQSMKSKDLIVIINWQMTVFFHKISFNMLTDECIAIVVKISFFLSCYYLSTVCYTFQQISPVIKTLRFCLLIWVFRFDCFNSNFF